MSEYIKSKSGLVYPKPKPEKPPRKYGALEIEDEEQRKKATRSFNTLLNLPHVRGGLLCKDPDKGEVLSKLIHNLAEIMLGNDWGCEILC